MAVIRASTPGILSTTRGYVLQQDKAVSYTHLDSGMGIPEDSIERIFERFYRVDKSHSKEIGSRYKIGSILNAPNTCAPTAKQWEKYIAQIQKISMKRIGIPILYEWFPRQSYHPFWLRKRLHSHA